MIPAPVKHLGVDIDAVVLSSKPVTANRKITQRCCKTTAPASYVGNVRVQVAPIVSKSKHPELRRRHEMEKLITEDPVSDPDTYSQVIRRKGAEFAEEEPVWPVGRVGDCSEERVIR